MAKIINTKMLTYLKRTYAEQAIPAFPTQAECVSINPKLVKFKTSVIESPSVVMRGGDFRNTALERMTGLTFSAIVTPANIYASLTMRGMAETNAALVIGLFEGYVDLSTIILEQLSEDIYSFIRGRMIGLGLNRTGKFLSKGKRRKEYTKYARLPRNVITSGGKISPNGVPYVSSYMNMGTRNTNDLTKAGAPHSVFVERGFKDRAGRQHAPRPIFKSARANMPAIVALATEKARSSTVRAVSRAVNSKLKPAPRP